MTLDEEVAAYMAQPDARALVQRLADTRVIALETIARLNEDSKNNFATIAGLNAQVAVLNAQIAKLAGPTFVPDLANRQFVATFPTAGPFTNALGDGGSIDTLWWVEQKAAGRALVIPGGRDGPTALRLHTEPGDNNVSGSGISERNDVALSQVTTDGFEGREHYWAHSIMLPGDFVAPPWHVLFDFHDTRNAGGQANFHLFAGPNGLSFKGHAGPTIVMDGAGNQYSYGGEIFSQLIRNVWLDFVYHVRWSSGPDGFFYAWLNGKRILSHTGPTLYAGYGVYLKLANYHPAFGQPVSVIHDRVIRGTTANSVALGPLE